MKYNVLHITYIIVTAIAVTLFLGCDRAEEIRAMSIKSDAPTTEGTGIDMKYVDSGKVTSHLKTPYVKDYGNAINPYREFPNGVEVTFIEIDGKESVITSDYAIQYLTTNLIDLQKNVKVVTSDSATLNAQQMYWDQNNSWIFTDKPYTIKLKDGSTNAGDLFDSNEKLTNFVSLNNISKQYVKEKS